MGGDDGKKAVVNTRWGAIVLKTDKEMKDQLGRVPWIGRYLGG